MSKLYEEGLIQVHGTNDVLTQALEKPEHYRRVRGAGAGFALKTYFTTTEGKKNCKRRTSELVERTTVNTGFATIKNEPNRKEPTSAH